MAVTKREQQMLALSDQGLSHSQIAERMGIQAGSVTRTLAMLSPDFASDRRRREAMIAGSQILAARINQLAGAS